MTRAAIAAALLLTMAAPAWAALDAENMKLWGVTWMADCNNLKGPKVTIFENDIVFLNGTNRVAAPNLQAQASYFGNSAPEGYLTALVGEEANGSQLIAIVYQDAQGQYLQIDGDAKIMARVGKAAAALKYRRCDGKKAPSMSDAAPAAPTTGAYLSNPKFRAAYFKALGPKAKVAWLATLDGPTPENKKVKIAGVEYESLASCKAHDCFDHSLVVLYSAARKVVFGTIHEGGKKTLIGGPSPAVTKELERLWVAQFRQNQ
jgi:hypothetical protein